ncbi:hypothetical protein [Dactylosporangium matsuzakiense]|uniref:Uncharacterized protein n=1 Tax=Dactylosporangium matsuzakiense TaxID=53360 RepID=A0A9W6KXR5_9ACTN|nr:hypothetical protein [Dactylosporangium matsuzakiense]UWZ44696.1 hypothetical protein Dmats_46475 [Dactylosporangium matsuzakiense]GLL08644.1 hypothetical protein GCM10017581_104110 [Dactylosporangium matsuzakiense]
MIRLQPVERGANDRVVPVEDLPAVYGATAADNGPTVTYTWDETSGDDNVVEAVIVGLIDDDWCYVSMLDAEDWSDLWDTEDETDATALVEIVLAGLPAFVPPAAIVPRTVGLAALVSAPTFSQVPSTYTWRRQPR